MTLDPIPMALLFAAPGIAFCFVGAVIGRLVRRRRPGRFAHVLASSVIALGLQSAVLGALVGLLLGNLLQP